MGSILKSDTKNIIYTQNNLLRPCSTYILGFLVEALLDKLSEGLGELCAELGRGVLGDEEEDAHRVQLRVGRLALRHLYGRDAQAPDVSLRTSRKTRH